MTDEEAEAMLRQVQGWHLPATKTVPLAVCIIAARLIEECQSNGTDPLNSVDSELEEPDLNELVKMAVKELIERGQQEKTAPSDLVVRHVRKMEHTIRGLQDKWESASQDLQVKLLIRLGGGVVHAIDDLKEGRKEDVIRRLESVMEAAVIKSVPSVAKPVDNALMDVKAGRFEQAIERLNAVEDTVTELMVSRVMDPA